MAERELIDVQKIKILLRKQFSVDEEGNLSDNSKLLVRMLQASLSQTVHLPYDAIAEYVFSENSENSIEENEDLNANIKYLLDNFSGNGQDILEKNLEKIKRHYNLSRIQKQYISKHTKDTQVLIEQLIPVTGTLSEQVTETRSTQKILSDELDAIKDTKSSIYTDFIAILGVFSAFVFALFGGLNMVSAMFDIADDLQTVSLIRIITIACILMMVICTLLYTLLLWISRITDKNFAKCFQKDCVNGCQHKLKHCFWTHSFYFGIMFFLGTTAVLVNVFLK